MQKLVTIALNQTDYIRSAGGQGPLRMAEHGEVEEHLATYLNEGWRIVSMTPVGTTAGGGEASWFRISGWLAVLLEKE